jgi:hypothetical protein
MRSHASVLKPKVIGPVWNKGIQNRGIEKKTQEQGRLRSEKSQDSETQEWKV